MNRFHIQHNQITNPYPHRAWSEPRILHILKKREINDDFTKALRTNDSDKKNLSTGLFNSANFIHNMLLDNNVKSDIVTVIDNNCIDREVTRFRPTFVNIEALWVVPEKFDVLHKLHPKVQWLIRFHSDTPFIAFEGLAFDWILRYLQLPNVSIGINSPKFYYDIVNLVKSVFKWRDEILYQKVLYLPNYYPISKVPTPRKIDKDTVDIGCFGAIRPLKNHLLQALSSIDFAEKKGKKLNFHINATRIEGNAQSILRNLEGLFENIKHRGHQLVKHYWLPHEEFLKVCSSIDIGLQVSLSETFNIVAADLIRQGIPVVGSEEIPWFSKFYCAEPTISSSILNALEITWENPDANVISNGVNLINYVERSKKIWLNYLGIKL